MGTITDPHLTEKKLNRGEVWQISQGHEPGKSQQQDPPWGSSCGLFSKGHSFAGKVWEGKETNVCPGLLWVWYVYSWTCRNTRKDYWSSKAKFVSPAAFVGRRGQPLSLGSKNGEVRKGCLLGFSEKAVVNFKVNLGRWEATGFGQNFWPAIDL